ncbi:hypothetical protein EU527_10570 [Candidatus Thorarchaeota archaeon]|nr:MAG: hypothetical protein EU527_10570 [Candidatus Thorarchaeota archaeon]
MSIHGVSIRRALAIAMVVVIGGIIIVGFTITLNPPTSGIPEPSFSHLSLNDLFRYYNTTQGGAITNSFEFQISFDNNQDGSAFLRLTSAIITIWVADITTYQPNTSLMQVDTTSTMLSCNPSREQNRLDVVESSVTADEWWTTGICRVILGTNELFSNNIIIVDYSFMLSNNLAMEYDGHQFLIKIQADITYGALYFGGLIGWHYQSATFDYILGEETPIYMAAIEV